MYIWQEKKSENLIAPAGVNPNIIITPFLDGKCQLSKKDRFILIEFNENWVILSILSNLDFNKKLLTRLIKFFQVFPQWKIFQNFFLSLNLFTVYFFRFVLLYVPKNSTFWLNFSQSVTLSQSFFLFWKKVWHFGWRIVFGKILRNFYYFCTDKNHKKTTFRKFKFFSKNWNSKI